MFTAQTYATAIIESSDDAILTKDLDGVILSCNPATQRIFGSTPDELIGRPVRMLIPDERQAEDDLLDIGRLVSGKLLVERARIDVNEVVRQATEMCLPAIEQRGQAFELVLPDTPTHVDADYTRMVRVVSNVLSNASKYTPERGRIALALHGGTVEARSDGFGAGSEFVIRLPLAGTPAPPAAAPVGDR